ncbi:hypothetical protein GCM10007036_36320 [Alsobacter metallidurans]|uniref:RES domain-containing protein n=1 Tax=Alsobacter metallidurans TaxID=340221 RepID=A0A917IAY2_9HYPH|nr:RES family NAD+ phosphorylase [Alsobacter metallidurans]GGH27649.1 hypothetical protein GCM10007036_36320 [Alsobacter metallidurans]
MATSAPALPAECLIVRLPAGTRVTRVHWSTNEPVWFGPGPGNLPGNRFDAPDGEFGTLYAAQELTGAFAETVLRRAARIVAWPSVRRRSWSTLELQRDVDVAQLHGGGLAWHGVTSDICSGDDYGPPQLLSLAFYSRNLDGIAYRSRHNNDEICYALYDRVTPAELKLVQTSAFAEYPAVADDLLNKVGAVWDPQLPLPDIDQLP